MKTNEDDQRLPSTGVTAPSAQLPDRLIALMSDSAGLVVAATWLWTRFDHRRNEALVRELAVHGLAPADRRNLKHVDQALRRACEQRPDLVRRWCTTSGDYVAGSSGNRLPSPAADGVAKSAQQRV